MDKHTVTWRKKKSLNEINKIKKGYKMWEYKTKLLSTYQLLGWIHFSVDRQRSTDKKL